MAVPVAHIAVNYREEKGEYFKALTRQRSVTELFFQRYSNDSLRSSKWKQQMISQSLPVHVVDHHRSSKSTWSSW